jgi:hypothetical protein
MMQFNLACTVTVSAYTSVEADSLEEAIDIARERDVELHFNGSGTSEDEVWCVEGADGCPTGICEA